MPATDYWREKLQCPACGKTGVASLSQTDGDALIVETVPHGFRVVAKQDFTDFYCISCNVAVSRRPPQFAVQFNQIQACNVRV